MLIIFYSTSDNYGEGWGTHSYVQLVGFILLLTGTLIYYDVIPLQQYCGHPEDETNTETSSTAPPPVNDASPSDSKDVQLEEMQQSSEDKQL